MPNIKDFENRPKKNQAKAGTSEAKSAKKPARRRPGRENEAEIIEASGGEKLVVVDVEPTKNATELTTAVGPEATTAAGEAQQTEARTSAGDEEVVGQPAGSDAARENIEINFPGSELIRAKYPKPFAIAEHIATDWLKGGDFSDLPIETPIAKKFAVEGLAKAKELETMILTSPKTEKIATELFTAGLKAQAAVNKIRERLNKK